MHMQPGNMFKLAGDWCVVVAYDGTTLVYRFEDDRLNTLYTLDMRKL